MNDTIGSQFMTTTAGAATTAYTFPINGNATTNTYTWWPYDYTLASRVAGLEGEVKVLREMLAALLSAKPAPRKRARK